MTTQTAAPGDVVTVDHVVERAKKRAIHLAKTARTPLRDGAAGRIALAYLRGGMNAIGRPRGLGDHVLFAAAEQTVAAAYEHEVLTARLHASAAAVANR